jgi:thiamine biosynthesis lipoprotein ApbE
MVHPFHASRAIGTTLDVLVATHSPAAAENAYTAITSEISRLEMMLSTRIPSSSVSQINQTNDPVVVPTEVIELLTAYQSAASLTSGLISPLTGELTTRWSAAAKQNTLPTAHELAAVTARIGQTTLAIDPINSTVQRIGPATLNIDALGKPFILQKATRYAWANLSLTGLLVNIGGDIMTLGSLDGLTPWSVEVADPNNPADNATPLATLKMTKYAVATSGDYARPRLIAGHPVSHILNPLNGQPANHSLAATVMHSDPVLANALATAFCVAGPSASDLAKQVGAEFLLASPNGVEISEKLPFAADAASGAPSTQPAAPQPAAWPKDFKATLALNLVATGRPEREYVAVWIQDPLQNHIKTLAVWGNDKYQRQALRVWIGLAVRGLRASATKNLGSYTLDWDGTDQAGKAVNQGNYYICVEASSEHGGHYYAQKEVNFGATKVTSAIAKDGAIDNSSITYGPPKAKAAN